MTDKKRNLFLLFFLWTGPGLISASAGSFESGTITQHVSSRGVSEQCVEIAPMPKAHYSKHDLKTQSDYCSIAFDKVALCPKLWSTSPGTIVYEIDATKYNNDYVKLRLERIKALFRETDKYRSSFCVNFSRSPVRFL